jgi:hypothetical protein
MVIEQPNRDAQFCSSAAAGQVFGRGHQLHGHALAAPWSGHGNLVHQGEYRSPAQRGPPPG